MSKKRKKVESTRKFPSWISPLILGLLVIGTFLLRVLPSWDKVFVDGQVWFRGADPWYHMRLVDNMMVNFPIPLKWDMLILFPEGMNVGYFPLLSWMVAVPGQIFNYELVGTFLPPILGALTLIPIYFICKTLWKGWVGLIPCLLVMILPTELYHRTLLGFTDHHALEVFFLVNTILFLILLTKNRKTGWAILAGVSLGLYMSSWTGGLLLAVPVWIWFLITFLYKLRKGDPIGPFCKDMSIVFGLGFLLFTPNMLFIKGLGPHVLLLGLMTISPTILFLVSKRLDWRRILKAIVGCLILFIILIQVFLPQVLDIARSVFMSPSSTIQEVQSSVPRVLMAHYGISFLLFIGGLIFSIKKKEHLLLVIWSIFMLILVLCQRRWSYYFVISNAILAGYFIYLISRWIHKETKHAVVIVICVLLLATTLSSTIGISQLPNTITNDWYQACVWLRYNTPEIEGYYDLEEDEVDYGVLSWWDYGNWITRIGHRSPNSNPMAQHISIQWQVFLAQSEEEANSHLKETEYIIVDEAMVTTKLYAIVKLAPSDLELGPDTFIITLWNEDSVTWKKIYQEGKVKIYGRC